MVSDISVTAIRLELISPNYMKSSLFKPQVKTSTTCKE
jgi:hypothetical protein